MAETLNQLAAKIALLYLITDLPERQGINNSDQYTEAQASQPGRILSFKHEVTIAQQLAFISAYSSNPLHIMAVSVEEDATRGRLTVRLAANAGKHEYLIDQVKVISQILQNEASNINRSMNYEDLLKAVVALNRGRILSRIRSRHSQNWRVISKAPLSRRLETAKQLLQNSLICSKSLANDLDGLQRQFDQLENLESHELRSSRSDGRILQLVKSIHLIFKQYEQDLALVPNTPGVWSGNSTEFLIDRLRKVSQYVRACEELLRAARRYKIFSTVTFEFVNLQRDGPQLSKDTKFDSDEIIQACCTRKTLQRVSSRRHESIWNTKENIKAQLRKTSRLHAEIQLVLHYEQIHTSLRPRVICSSKSACYLCYLFMEVHGQYYVPSTHGRLYDTWKWPDPDDAANIGLQLLLPKFSSAIDRKIRDCLGEVPTTKRNDPLESRVDLLAPMTPSILSYISQKSRSACSKARKNREVKEYSNSETQHDNDIDILSSTSLPNRTSEPAQPTERSLLEGDGPMMTRAMKADDLIWYDDSVIPNIKIQTPSNISLPAVLEGDSPNEVLYEVHPECSGQRRLLSLRKGESASRPFDTENLSLYLQVPGLHISLEYDPLIHNSVGHFPNDGRRVLQLAVECLSSATHLEGKSLMTVVDLDRGGWVEKSAPEGILFSSEGLLLKHKSVMLRLRAQFEQR